VITRRDFLDGIALGIAAAGLSGCRCRDDDGPARPPAGYPPARTGMRGSHPGSFEVAHQLRDGARFGPPEDTGEHHDLIVVGAGISGLAAAYFYRRAHPGASILLIDNHDDFGGHAKRNEFDVGGRTLVSYGGTESIEYPSQYSDVAKRLIAEIGIDVGRFHAVFPDPPIAELGLAGGVWFGRETFGTDRLVRGSLYEPTDEMLAQAPVTAAVRDELIRLFRGNEDYWAGETSAAKKARLAKLSYRAFLIDVVKLAPETVRWFETSTHSLYGVGIDAVPALDCWALELPGFAKLGLDRAEPSPGIGKTPLLEMHDEPNVQFVDGNATVARLLVRSLLPEALPATSMQDVVTAPLDYGLLDAAGPIRIRLSTTAIQTRNVPGGVEVDYVRGGRPQRVRGTACVLACWHTVIPYLAPELSAEQRTALAYAVKVPLTYTNVALRSWRAFHQLGLSGVEAPSSYFTSAHLELHGTHPTPDQPAIVKLVRTPCHAGAPAREQHRLGRHELLATPFATFEHHVRDQLGRLLADGGFDPERDIAAITVNRWSHGYAYEYNSLWDHFPAGAEPCVIARRPFGRIAIANSDAGAYAYTDSAIDQAWRAIRDLG